LVLHKAVFKEYNTICVLQILFFFEDIPEIQIQESEEPLVDLSLDELEVNFSS
jgi:hypothetical protein